MDIMVWAHWRYRVLGLESDIDNTTSRYRNAQMMNGIGSRGAIYDEAHMQQFKDELAFQGWLLEEAKYMCELGAAYDARDELCSMPLV